MERWSEVRRRVLTGELSKRQACQKYKLHWDTLKKILGHCEPPGYRTQAPREKPVLGSFVAIIHEILEADRKAPPKQRHTAKRILERLRNEHGYRGGRTVAEHLRDWDKENVHYAPVHYLALLERKPGALDFGKPLADWNLPEGFGVLRRRLEGELGSTGRREFIKVLRLLESCELGELARAVDRALQIGALTVEAIRLLLQDGREAPVKYFRLDGRPHLEGRVVPPPKLSLYDTLRHQEAFSHEET